MADNGANGGAEASASSDFSARNMITATACLLGATFIPYVQATVGPLFMLPMIAEFGWSRTEYAFATTFFFLFGSITVLVFGRIADRVGVRPILLAGAVFGGATMILLSTQTASLWRLYATYALLGGFGSSGVGYTKVIGALFTRHRGKALALFGAESTVALAVLPILTNTLIAHFGWRGAYVVFGGVMLLLIPVIYFLIAEPRGAASGQGAPSGGRRNPPAPLYGMTISEIRRDRTFWLVVLTAVLGGGLNAGLMAHIVAAITDKGFSPTVAAEALAVSTLVGLVGAFAGGFAVDHFRRARVLSAFGLLSGVGMFLFAFADRSFGGLPMLIAAMAVQAVAVSAMRPIGAYLQTRFFGLRAFAQANAVQVVFQGVTMAAAPPLFGIIYERAGSYAPVYWILVGSAVAGALVYLLLGPYRYRADTGAEILASTAGGPGQVSGPDGSPALPALRT